MDKRVYVASMNIDEKNTFLGVYTNKKNLLDALSEIGVSECYIKAKRKNVNVNANTLHTHFSDRIIIYSKDIDGNEISKFKVLEVKLNKFSPIIQSAIENKE